MAGGLGKIHNKHFSSMRVASVYFALKYPRNKSIEKNFENLPESKVGMCTKSCIMFKNNRCEALGIIAPLGNDCEAQLISRRER